MTSAAERWRDALEAWAIPPAILASAEESPWIHPPELFTVPATADATPSHDRAREALVDRGSVLDVGCGGGAAAFALTPPAASVVGVDHQPEMLAMFEDNAAARGVACETIEGFWPAVANQAPVADVVTSHHVVYNVADAAPFLAALSAHARRRVVLEMPDHHPLSSMSDAWATFWQLERPSGPTPDDLVAVLDEMGVAAHRERFRAPQRSQVSLERAAHFLRVRLCLAPSREGEVYDYLAAQPTPAERELSTVWWDVGAIE